MGKLSPWVGVALLVAAMIAQFVFGKYHVDAGSLVSTCVGVAIAILYGGIHQSTRVELQTTKSELTELRASMRPAREPSMHDIEIPKTGR
jgi:hypothetical protein